jgi:hypothetical protein
MDDWYHAAPDDVSEHQSGADARKLIGIPDKNQACLAGEGIQKTAHEWHIDHGDFIDDQDIALERVGGISLKASACRLKFQQPVESGSLKPGCLRKTLSRPPRGRGE